MKAKDTVMSKEVAIKLMDFSPTQFYACPRCSQALLYAQAEITWEKAIKEVVNDLVYHLEHSTRGTRLTRIEACLAKWRAMPIGWDIG